MLKQLSNEQGYLKAGLLGYAKSGKSYTATKMAIGVKLFFKLPGPIAFFDTEAGSGYISEMVKAETGQELVGVRARSFKELMEFTKDCIEAKVSVALVDSVTHPWRELCDSYLAQLNQRRRERNFAPLQKLEFQHWGAIKAQWEPWANFFLNSPLHMIVCGRAGAIWEMEKNEETGRKELIQSGVKMKVETEFGFESSLLIEMEREQVPDGNGGFKVMHRATVMGDRFSVIDGATTLNPTFDFFLPHIQKLKPGAHSPVNTATKTDTGADVEGSGEWEREKKARTILCEEIQGLLVARWPGQSAEEKKQKADAIYRTFNTRSWTAVESFNSAVLREGLARMRTEAGEKETPIAPAVADDNPELRPQEVTPSAVPLEKQAEEPKGPSPLQPAGYNPCKFMRLLANEKKVKEGEVLGAIKELGMVDKQYWTFEELLLADQKVFDKLHREIADVVSKIVKAKEGK